MPRLLSAVFGALALILSVIVIGAAPASAASARHWTLSGVTFDDGGTLSGTLLIGNDGTLLSVDVTTSGGDTGTFGTYHYTDADPKQRIFGGWSVQRGLGSVDGVGGEAERPCARRRTRRATRPRPRCTTPCST